MSEQTKTKAPTERNRRKAREPKTEVHISADKPQTKTDLILGLLRREEGATLEQLVAATGWLPHTTRAALTGIKRKGHVLSSEKTDGARTYRVAPAGATA